MSEQAHEEPTAAGHALLLDTDLFFVAKITGTLKHMGYTAHTARRADDFARRLAEERPTLALVNFAVGGVDWQSAIRAARAAKVPVIAFGPHVDVEMQAEARAAGASRVIANSKLGDLPGIVAQTLRRFHSHSTASTETADVADDDGAVDG